MFAVDTSTLVAFNCNEDGKDVELFMNSMLRGNVRIPPLVIAEIMSNPTSQPRIEQIVQKLTDLPITEGYWQRAGMLRCAVLRTDRKARIGDALIAQSCIDHDVHLITRDLDFRHFVKHGGLKLAK